MYQFTDDCLTGIEIIDNEHRRLFAMINEGIDMIHGEDKIVLAVAKDMVVQLKEYAVKHFADEEEIMEKLGDAELERQRREHDQFRAYMDSHDESQLTEENARQKVEELLLYLAKWLYSHILGSDIMISHNINNSEGDPFAFTDKFLTGIELVDEEHKILFDIIRQTNDTINEEFVHDKYDRIMEIIDELKDYTVKHFGDEEEYMESIGYEGLEAQKVAHISFVDKLNSINYDNLDDNQQEYLNDLVEYLLNWLSTHILKMDKRIPVKDIKK